jgi:hypothetical protein
LRRFLCNPLLSLSRIWAYAKFTHFRLDFVVVIASGMAARSEEAAIFNALDGAEELRAVFGFQARPARSACKEGRHGLACKKARTLGSARRVLQEVGRAIKHAFGKPRPRLYCSIARYLSSSLFHICNQ